MYNVTAFCAQLIGLTVALSNETDKIEMTFVPVPETDDEDSSENTTSNISTALVKQASTYATDLKAAQVIALKSPDKSPSNLFQFNLL